MWVYHCWKFRLMSRTTLMRVLAICFYCFRTFKVYHQGTTFLFRADTEAEKYEWINVLSLASIEYQLDTLPLPDSDISGATVSSKEYSDEEEDVISSDECELVSRSK